MNFNEYQKETAKTAIYPKAYVKNALIENEEGYMSMGFIYPMLGLAGEAGELAEKIKKIFRDDLGTLSGEKMEEIKKEIGDVMWYVSQLATELGLSLDDIVSSNIAKLRSRQERGKLQGSGDNR